MGKSDHSHYFALLSGFVEATVSNEPPSLSVRDISGLEGDDGRDKSRRRLNNPLRHLTVTKNNNSLRGRAQSEEIRNKAIL